MADLRVDIWAYNRTAKVWENVADIDPTAPRNPLESFSVEPRHNAAGPWSLILPTDVLADYDADDEIPHLVVTGDFRGTRETCLIDDVEERYDDDGMPVYELSGTTAFGLLGDGAGFPNPLEAVADQSSVRWYKEGPAEDVVASVIRANLVTRLGYDMIVASSQGRGSTVVINSEFTNLLELVTEAASLGGIGVKVGLVNRAGSNSRADMAVSFYLPKDRSADFEFSREAQSLLSWKRKRTRATATRVIVQSGKERQTRQVASANLSANSITTANDRKTKNREVESVNVAANTITTKSSHEMPTGSRIEFTDGTPPAPLARDTTYYSIKVDGNTIRVANSKTAANNGNAIALTNNGAGQIVVTRVIIKPVKHKLRAGDIITFSGGTPPEPLETDVDYHAVRVDANTFQVALTRADAAKGIVVALTSQPEGDVQVAESTRHYQQVINATAESDPFGRVRESLIVGNADDAELSLTQQGREALREGKAQVAVELETTEALGARYADPISLGDTVAFGSPSGKRRTDIIGAAQVAYTSDSGLTVQMIPGEPDVTTPERQRAADYRRIRRKASKARED